MTIESEVQVIREIAEDDTMTADAKANAIVGKIGDGTILRNLWPFIQMLASIWGIVLPPLPPAPATE